MSLTKDNRKVIDQVMAGLFPHHPYGTQTILGTQENLKNPSITNIKNFYTQWYLIILRFVFPEILIPM